jgi:hypothetical protein
MIGTNPFSYPLLVQPVLDKHCVKCHEEEKDAPPLDSSLVKMGRGSYMNPDTTYYTSYKTLEPSFGFYDYGGKSWGDPKWYRTTPGEFGARASKLYALLKKSHYEVKLSPEEMHRITVWLDSCTARSTEFTKRKQARPSFAVRSFIRRLRNYRQARAGNPANIEDVKAKEAIHGRLLFQFVFTLAVCHVEEHPEEFFKVNSRGCVDYCRLHRAGQSVGEWLH